MKYLIIMGRGIEGCGNTRNSIELENYLKEQGNLVVTISNKESKIGRSKAHKHNIKEMSFNKDVDNIIKLVNGCDRIVVTSVPPKKMDEENKDNFMKVIKHAHEAGKKLTYLQFDHKSQSIARNMYVEDKYLDFFKYIDLVITHSYDNDFRTKFLLKNNIECNKIVARDSEHNNFFSIDFDSVKKDHWKEFGEKEDRSIRFLGRSAGWKGPWLLRQMHKEHFRSNNYITYIEGIEMSIGVLAELFTEIKPTKIVRDDNIIICFNKDDNAAFANGTYEFKRNAPAYILPPYNRDDGLERMGKTMFGCELILMDDYIAKDMIENAMLEMVACGTIPVFRKHWGEIFRVNGRPLIDYGSKEIGTIFLDEEDPSQTVQLMNSLSSDEHEYNIWRENAYKFYKSIFDNSVILKMLKQLIDEA